MLSLESGRTAGKRSVEPVVRRFVCPSKPVGQGVPRGGCDSAVQRKTSRHESVVLWSPTDNGQHTQVRPGSGRVDGAV